MVDVFSGKKANSSFARRALRSVPESDLSSDSVDSMIMEKGFYCRENESGRGLSHKYEKKYEGQIVYDHASGLSWQQSGSNVTLSHEEAMKYIDKLNHDRFANCSNWRLPTLEEAMSLMDPNSYIDFLCIDPVFDTKQTGIWTSDSYDEGNCWMVGFNTCSCSFYARTADGFHVRAVRSG